MDSEFIGDLLRIEQKVNGSKRDQTLCGEDVLQAQAGSNKLVAYCVEVNSTDVTWTIVRKSIQSQCVGKRMIQHTFMCVDAASWIILADGLDLVVCVRDAGIG